MGRASCHEDASGWMVLSTSNAPKETHVLMTRTCVWTFACQGLSQDGWTHVGDMTATLSDSSKDLLSWFVRKALCVTLFDISKATRVYIYIIPSCCQICCIALDSDSRICLTCNSFNQVPSVHYRIDFNDCVACTFLWLQLWRHHGCGDDGPWCAVQLAVCCRLPGF